MCRTLSDIYDEVFSAEIFDSFSNMPLSSSVKELAWRLLEKRLWSMLMEGSRGSSFTKIESSQLCPRSGVFIFDLGTYFSPFLVFHLNVYWSC